MLRAKTEMGTIKILPEVVANRIAAGEVIERPASVVKELVENAIDAGATRIGVTVSYGGKRYIRVQDNGCGMDREDAQLCLVRHATSKIATAEDIQHIATLGFRGEALPSIAAVSRLSLTTRTADAPTATRVSGTGGVIESVSETVAEPGTTVEVADLFFNTPARKKFLRSDAAEYTAIAEVFDTLALSRRDIAFSLSNNNVVAASYPAAQDLRERIIHVYDEHIANQMLPVQYAAPGLVLSGYIGLPDLSRVNRTGQKFFINTRPVQSFALSMALSRAYEKFLEKGRFPVGILFIDIDEAAIDVNVHPAKREVRIRNERVLIDQIAHVLKKELHRARGSQPASSAAPAPLKPTFHEHSAVSSGPTLQLLREQAAEWQTPPEVPVPDTPVRDAPLFQERSVENMDQEPGGDNFFSRMTILGQVLNAYILARCDDGIVIIDQHATHERIVFESLLRASLQRQPVSQTMLFPATLHLTLQEAHLMEAYLPEFQLLGFSISSLGGMSFLIDAVPACIGGSDPVELIRDCLHELMEGSPLRSFASRQESLAALVACKTYAVKAGKPLSHQEMETLIKQLGRQENPQVCPHGRPTYFIVSRHEIERRLKRR